jgi:glycosyltransferase involved in cell wall biosynthesis
VIPCYDEALTIGKVVADFARELPAARILVFDNASTDGSGEIARGAGAEVIVSPLRGKGNLLRQVWQVVDADVYVLVDGDDTYPASAVQELILRFEREPKQLSYLLEVQRDETLRVATPHEQ